MSNFDLSNMTRNKQTCAQKEAARHFENFQHKKIKLNLILECSETVKFSVKCFKNNVT